MQFKQNRVSPVLLFLHLVNNTQLNHLNNVASEALHLNVTGFVEIFDTTETAGEIAPDSQIVQQHNNHIHPQNMSRVFARALANEQNHSIYRIAFGNGGTYIDATGVVAFKTPNDGQLPDIRGWQSRLYNEIYSEVIDDSSVKFGTGPGADPRGDGTNTGVVSRSVGIQSQAVITAVLNAKEPLSQRSSSLANAANESTNFIFDEIALYTSGLPPLSTSGSQDVFIGNQQGSSSTGLKPFTPYSLDVDIDGAGVQHLVFSFTNADLDPSTKQIKFVTLANKINSVIKGAVALVTQPGIETYGNFRITSLTTGPVSSVKIVVPMKGTANYSEYVFANLRTETGTIPYNGVDSSRPGLMGGVEERIDDQALEQERLLTHLIFHPIMKARDRVWTLRYTLTITVDRTYVP